MGRASAILVALALLYPVRGAHAECLALEGAIECGGVEFSTLHGELRDGALEAAEALAVLPDGRIIQADSLRSECENVCALSNVTLSGAPEVYAVVVVDEYGVHAGGEVLAPFGIRPAAGVASVEVRWADSTPTAGVGVLVPATAERAVTSLVAAGPDTMAMSLGLLSGAGATTRLDVARVYGRNGFTVSGAERIDLGPLQLSLDGTLGNSEGRAFFAGSQRHFGVGREELVVGLSAGNSEGLISVRYVAERGSASHTDAILLDGLVTGTFGAADAVLEIGAGATAAAAAFEPSLGTALTVEVPSGGIQWAIVPRASVRVVGERSEESRDDAEGTDTAGLSGGLFVEFVPLLLRQFELHVVADGTYGAVLSTGQSEFRAWNTPIDGWRAAGGVEARVGHGTIVRWLGERAESQIRGNQSVALTHAGTSGWASGQVRFDAQGYQSAWAMAGARTETLQVRIVALQGEDNPGHAPVLERRNLRRADGGFETPTSVGMGLTYSASIVTLDAESTYSAAAIRGPRFGGFGSATFQLPGRAWGLNTLVGTLVGTGEVHASVGLQLGEHPGVSGWHRR